MSMFYTAVCLTCNRGLHGDCSAYGHERAECEEFQRIRRELRLLSTVRTDQLDLQNALKFEKKHGRLPALGKE